MWVIGHQLYYEGVPDLEEPKIMATRKCSFTTRKSWKGRLAPWCLCRESRHNLFGLWFFQSLDLTWIIRVIQKMGDREGESPTTVVLQNILNKELVILGITQNAWFFWNPDSLSNHIQMLHRLLTPHIRWWIVVSFFFFNWNQHLASWDKWTYSLPCRD